MRAVRSPIRAYCRSRLLAVCLAWTGAISRIETQRRTQNVCLGSAAGGRIDINHATPGELLKVPGMKAELGRAHCVLSPLSYQAGFARPRRASQRRLRPHQGLRDRASRRGMTVSPAAPIPQTFCIACAYRACYSLSRGWRWEPIFPEFKKRGVKHTGVPMNAVHGVDTGCLRATSDKEMREIGPSPKGCGANPAILCCRPRPWSHQSLRPPPRLA